MVTGRDYGNHDRPWVMPIDDVALATAGGPMTDERKAALNRASDAAVARRNLEKLAPEMAEAILAWSFASADDLGAQDAAEDLLDYVADKLRAIGGQS